MEKCVKGAATGTNTLHRTEEGGLPANADGITASGTLGGITPVNGLWRLYLIRKSKKQIYEGKGTL